MSNIWVKELLKNYPKQNFGTDAQREERIQNFMLAHPELFKWFFEEPNGAHSKNLLEADIDDAYTTVLRFTDLIPGTKIRLVFAQSGNYDSSDSIDIIIGATGNYFADDIRPVYGIYFIGDANNPSNYPASLSGSFAYQYQVPTRSEFGSISKIQTDVSSYRQFVGNVDNLIESLECTREQVTKVCMSRYFKRPVEYLFYKGESLSNYNEDVFSGYDAQGYKTMNLFLRDKLYWDTSYTGMFDEKEHLEYSPFSIYVLKNSYLTVNGEKQDILNHIKNALPNTSDRTHIANHMFEKYYIDRYMNAQTAEDKLTERMALAARIAACEDADEKALLQNALAADPVYLLDPWVGKLYKVGENYNYNPTIVYNNEPIDLREIQRYDLDNLEPSETSISVGNGVYGDIFYQKVTMSYSFEDNGDEYEDLITAKKNWSEVNNTLISKREGGLDPLRAELENLDEKYAVYNDLLATAITNWVTRESDLEE